MKQVWSKLIRSAFEAGLSGEFNELWVASVVVVLPVRLHSVKSQGRKWGGRAGS